MFSFCIDSCIKYTLYDLLRSCESMTSCFYFLNLFISKQLKDLGLICFFNVLWFCSDRIFV